MPHTDDLDPPVRAMVDATSIGVENGLITRFVISG
jgi:hypothetical protein